jgi:hypothetical protein
MGNGWIGQDGRLLPEDRQQVTPEDCVREMDWVQLMTSAGSYVSAGTVTGTRRTRRGFTATWEDVGTGWARQSVVPPPSGHVMTVIRGQETWEVRGNPVRKVQQDPTVFVAEGGSPVTYATTGEHVTDRCPCGKCTWVRSGSVTSDQITAGYIEAGTVTAGPLVPTPAKDEAQEKLVKPQEVRRQVLVRHEDDEKVTRQDAQLAAATEQLIREMGEAGWRSQYFTGDSGSLPWEKARAYTAWKSPRDQYAVSGDEADLRKMLAEVDFVNPPDATVLDCGQARTRTTKTKVKTWHDIDGRPHTSTVTRPVRGVHPLVLVLSCILMTLGAVLVMMIGVWYV